MKYYIISFSLKKGGASIAALKFKKILLDSKFMFHIHILNQDSFSVFHLVKRIFSFLFLYLQWDGNPIKHSLNLFSYGPLLKVFKKDVNSIFHFHWINNDTLSVFDFHKIPKGSIITLHDEWLYCGSEHCYKITDNAYDFISGYNFFKKGVYGFHWNYFIWKIKKNNLQNRKDLIYTVPSKWMFNRAKSSVILKYSDIRYLPNPIDTNIFQPYPFFEIEKFKDKYYINDDDLIFSFGFIGRKKNILKGDHLLESSLKILRDILPPQILEKIILIDFGGNIADNFLQGFRIISIGYIKSPEILALLYSASDCVVVPSMVESFGQVAAESLSCGTPVICFETSGLQDLVIHNKTGFVCTPFDSESMALEISKMILLSKNERLDLGRAGREHVIENFSFDLVQKKYEEIILDAIKLKDMY